MRILNIAEDFIEFDNGKSIQFEHYPGCCEYNLGRKRNDSQKVLDKHVNLGYNYLIKNEMGSLLICFP